MIKEILQIKIEISKRIFCFYALLNVSGYNPKIYPVHPVRRKARIFLKRILAESKNDLDNFKKLMNRPDISKEFWFPLRNWILCHEQPPLFKESLPYWKNFLDVQIGEEFNQKIKNFWKTGRLSYLWGIVKNDYLKINKRCFYNAEIAVKNSLKYLRLENKKLDFKKFIVIPNFLDEYNRGIGPKINDAAYAILGPSRGIDAFPMKRIQHEFLHSLINPITQKVLGNRVSKPELSSIRELLIQAIILRINKYNVKYYQKKLKRLRESKFKIDKVIDFLENYEMQRENFETFLSKNNTWNQ